MIDEILGHYTFPILHHTVKVGPTKRPPKNGTFFNTHDSVCVKTPRPRDSFLATIWFEIQKLVKSEFIIKYGEN